MFITSHLLARTHKFAIHGLLTGRRELGLQIIRQLRLDTRIHCDRVTIRTDEDTQSGIVAAVFGVGVSTSPHGVSTLGHPVGIILITRIGPGRIQVHGSFFSKVFKIRVVRLKITNNKIKLCARFGRIRITSYRPRRSCFKYTITMCYCIRVFLAVNVSVFFAIFTILLCSPIIKPIIHPLHVISTGRE